MLGGWGTLALRVAGAGDTSLIAVPCPKCQHPGAVVASFYAFFREVEDEAEMEQPESVGHALLQLWCPKCGLVESVGAWPKDD